MKSKLTILFFLFTFTLSFAQQKSKVTGIVFDKTLQESVPYSTVTIKKGTEIITGAMTDENGKFDISLPQDAYNLSIQFIGYKDHNQDIKLTSNLLDLGTIYIEAEATTLEGVNIVAEQSSIEQKIDSKVINVGKDLSTVGATASEIMNNIPSVNVDQDGKLSLRGNSNVRVLVDGRPTNIPTDQLLKQIPSTSIKRIELITNPSAKYNPEGMTGIINLVLHKNSSDGFNGSIDVGLTIAEKVKNNNSINFNYRAGKLNFFGNGSTSHGNYLSEGHQYRDLQDATTLIDVKTKSNNYLYKVGMDYYINDFNTI